MSFSVRRSVGAACVAMLALLPMSARAIDYTDLWWTPAEAGWGVNLVQSDNFMFLTFFIYGQDNKPTWYTAQLSLDNTGAYSGGLYATTGTYYNNPWNTGDAIPPTLVGSAQFKPSADNAYQATLTYVVNGVGTVTKAVQRQTLTPINLAGNYTGGLAGVQSGCSNSGNYTANYNLQVSQDQSGNFSLAFTYPTFACTLSGTLVQTGSQYNASNAEYKCTQNGSQVFSSSANISQLKATNQGIEGQWVAPVGGGCTENANFSAVLM